MRVIVGCVQIMLVKPSLAGLCVWTRLVAACCVSVCSKHCDYVPFGTVSTILSISVLCRLKVDLRMWCLCLMWWKRLNSSHLQTIQPVRRVTRFSGSKQENVIYFSLRLESRKSIRTPGPSLAIYPVSQVRSRLRTPLMCSMTSTERICESSIQKTDILRSARHGSSCQKKHVTLC